MALDAWHLWLSVVVGGGSAFLGLGFGFGGIGQLLKRGSCVKRGHGCQNGCGCQNRHGWVVKIGTSIETGVLGLLNGHSC